MTRLTTFRCIEYAATLTPSSCAARHVAASRAHRPGAESSWHLTACRGCRVGKAHASKRSAPGVDYVERELVSLRRKPEVQAPPVAEPLHGGAPTPDLEAQQRDAARTAQRAERRRAAARARRAKREQESRWPEIVVTVQAWLAEDPSLTRRALYARAVTELGVTVTPGRFTVQLANRLGVLGLSSTSTSDETVMQHMRPLVAADPSRGWRWHAESLRSAGLIASADRVRRALRALRDELVEGEEKAA